VDLRRLPGHRELGIDDRGQGFVRHDDRVGGVACEVPIRRHDHGNRLAGKADDVGGDRMMDRRGEGRADRHRREELGDLLAGIHRLDALHRLRRARVDRDDAAVRDVAALERQVLHAGDLDVVDVGAQALNQARVLAPLDALAHELRQNRSGHGYLLLAAYCTALTMC
jgi:hypothetical protein